MEEIRIQYNTISEAFDKLSKEQARVLLNLLEEKFNELSREIIPVYIRMLTTPPPNIQRQLALTALYDSFRGQENAGTASEIKKTVMRLFPMTSKMVWSGKDMGISIGQVLRYLRDEVSTVKHEQRRNPEGYTEHFYWVS